MHGYYYSRSGEQLGSWVLIFIGYLYLMGTYTPEFMVFAYSVGPVVVRNLIAVDGVFDCEIKQTGAVSVNE